MHVLKTPPVLAALSLLCLFGLYIHVPNAVTFDVSFSLFAAQNAVAGNGLVTLEPNLPFPADLSEIRLRWLTTWPPAVSLLYTVLLGTGAGTATRLLAAVSVAGGTFGWLSFFRASGLPKVSLQVLAVLIPWTSFPVFALRSFYNDHLLWGLTPWALLALLRLPDRESSTGPWNLLKLAGTGLLCGLPFGIKYSAFPLLPAAVGYVLLRNGPRISLAAMRETLFFGLFVAAPPAGVFLTNRLLSGEGSAVLHGGVRLGSVGWAQVAHLWIPPLLDVTGWAKIFSRLPPGLQWVAPVCGVGLTGCLALGVRQILGRAETKRSLRILGLFCGAVAGFLLCLTVFLGYFYDWTSETRYYFPIYFGVFAFGLGLVVHPGVPRLLRVGLFLSAGLPALASLCAAAAYPFRSAVEMPLPKSGLGGSKAEATGYAFLHTLPAPDLVLSEKPLPMNELGVPAVPWFYLENHGQLTSSRPLKVWALLGPDATERLRKMVGPGVRLVQPPVPDAFPWQFTEIEFL